MSVSLIQSLVDELAEGLSRAVVVDDPEIRLICASRHYGDEDQQRIRAVLQRTVGLEATQHILSQNPSRWAGAGVIPANTELGMGTRWCVPIRYRGKMLGLLLVIDVEETLTDAEKSEINRVAAEIGGHLYATYLEAADRRASQERAVEDLLSSDELVRKTGLRNLDGVDWLAGAGSVFVTVLRVMDQSSDSSLTAREALRTALNEVAESAGPHRFGITIDHSRACLVESCGRSSAIGEVRKRAELLVDAVEQVLGHGALCVAGISGSVTSPEEAWCAYEQATIAVDAATATSSTDKVASWDELGAYSLLAQLPPRAFSPALLPRPVRRLLEADDVGWMVETLTSFLDHAGSAPRTAAALHMHRTSLYYRLDRIREVTGLDLDDGDTRLLLHIGVRIIAMNQSRARGAIAGDQPLRPLGRQDKTPPLRR
ncbi:UNVERIFIED_CONTAM: PucR-like helix-turn-helix protein [Williamsia faeni]